MPGATPDWLAAYQQWFTSVCPGCTWLYRGQAASYKSVVPSLLRPASRNRYGAGLFDMSARVTHTILASSTAIPLDRLHDDLGQGDTVSLMGGMLSMFLLGGTTPPGVMDVTRSEILRALAQHYDFPTLYIDVSLSPQVAAFFATHEFHAGGYRVRNAPAVVMRWPALRRSGTRLEISLDGEPEHRGWGKIEIVDIHRSNPYFVRPTNQAAALAKPVFRPWDIAAPETLAPEGAVPFFTTPLEDLTVIDMPNLTNADFFEFPAGAGQELSGRLCLNADALFPNQVDLGYSSFCLIALLSMVAHDPDQWGVDRSDEPHVPRLRQWWVDSTGAGIAILDREHMRLIPGYRTPRKNLFLSRQEMEDKLNAMVRTAIQALELGRHRPSSAGPQNPLRTKIRKWVDAEWKRRHELMNEVLTKTLADDGRTLAETLDSADPVPGADQPREAEAATRIDSAVAEIERRHKMVQQVIEYVDAAPAYAILNPEQWKDLLNISRRHVEYESRVRFQAEASRAWRASQSVRTP